jgi:hypothetical protein
MPAETGSEWVPPPPPPISRGARPTNVAGPKLLGMLDIPSKDMQSQDEEDMYTRAAAALEQGWKDGEKEENICDRFPATAATEQDKTKYEQSDEEALMDSILQEAEDGGLGEGVGDNEFVYSSVLPDEEALRQRAEEAKEDGDDWELQDVEVEQNACARLSPTLAETDSSDKSTTGARVVAKAKVDVGYRKHGRLQKALEALTERNAQDAAVESSILCDDDRSLRPSERSSEGSERGRKITGVAESYSQSESEGEGSLPSRGSSVGSF